MAVNANSRQSSITETHQGSSMRHHHHQPTKDVDKRAQAHKFEQGNLTEKQSRRKQDEPERNQKTDMPPRMRKPVTLKPSTKKTGRKTKDTKDQPLWPEHPVEITEDLIHHVTGLPKMGDKVPMDIPSAKMSTTTLGRKRKVGNVD